VFEVLHTGGNVVEKMLSGLCQTDAAVAPLEQENPKILFELDDAHTDGGLTYAQSRGGMAKVQMFGHGQGLNQRHQWNAGSQCRLGCRARGSTLN
jgi:hypothetical protein